MIVYELVTSLLVLLTLAGRICSAAPHISRFSSHVSFTSPTGAYSHGVGDLLPMRFNSRQQLWSSYGTKPFRSRHRYGALRSFQSLPLKTVTNFRTETAFEGYPREKPSIPFNYPSLTQGNSISTHSTTSFGNDGKFGHANSYTIPALPPSPYKVDSPDAESLWPEGLFVPPSVPFHNRNKVEKPSLPSLYGPPAASYGPPPPHAAEGNSLDPYLLEGIEAVQALERIIAHGELFHHEIPHQRALLANQRHRVENGLQPNRLGSIRATSPWLRL